MDEGRVIRGRGRVREGRIDRKITVATDMHRWGKKKRRRESEVEKSRCVSNGYKFPHNGPRGPGMWFVFVFSYIQVVVRV